MKAPIVQSGALPGNEEDCEIGVFIGLHGHNVSKRTRIAAGVSFHGYRLLQLKYDVENRVL